MIPVSAIGAMETRMAELIAERRLISKEVEKRGRKTLDDAQNIDFRRLSADIADLREAIEAAKEDRARGGELSSAADNIFTASGQNGSNTMTQENRALEHLSQSGVYNLHNQTGPERRSFIADLMAVSMPGADVHGEASARLARHADEMRNSGLEARTALDTTVGNSGGFSPPAYMISQYAEYARPAAVTTNLIPSYELTAPVINIPKITQGTIMSTQSAQNTALTESDITDEYLTQTAVTLGVRETASRQLLDLAVPGLDQILFRDLAAAHATFLDNAILNGTGSPTLTGILQQPSLATMAIPQTGTVVQNLYAGIAQGLRFIAINRYLPATAIVMSPSRWYSLASETDEDGRPLIVATGDGNQAFNAAGTAVSGAPSAGLAGHLLGLPIYLDAQLADADILIGRFEDAARYTSGLRLQLSFEPLLGQLSALLVAYSYETLFVRYLPSFALLTDSMSPTWGKLIMPIDTTQDPETFTKDLVTRLILCASYEGELPVPPFKRQEAERLAASIYRIVRNEYGS